MGKLKLFLGIEVIEKVDGLSLTQRKYFLELLNYFGMLGCKPIKKPLDLNSIVSSIGFDEKDFLLENITEYQKLIGKLLYLTITKLDILERVLILVRVIIWIYVLTLMLIGLGVCLVEEVLLVSVFTLVVL